MRNQDIELDYTCSAHGPLWDKYERACFLYYHPWTHQIDGKFGQQVSIVICNNFYFMNVLIWGYNYEYKKLKSPHNCGQHWVIQSYMHGYMCGDISKFYFFFFFLFQEGRHCIIIGLQALDLYYLTVAGVPRPRREASWLGFPVGARTDLCQGTVMLGFSSYIEG